MDDRLLFSAAPGPMLVAPAPDAQIEMVLAASLDAPVEVLAQDQPTAADVSGPISILEHTQADSILTATTRELVFIDTGAENYQALLDDLWSHQDPNRHIDVVLLSANEDGITQITETLSQYTTEKLDAVHFVTHGADRAIKLGNTWLDAASLDQNRDQIASWGEALQPGADLLIYGCDLAGNDLGRALLNNLVDLTGADIAASIDDTGSSLLGGDWDLEYELGEIESDVAFSGLLQSEWESLLNTFSVTNTSNSGAGSLRQAILNANALGGTDTISFNIGAPLVGGAHKIDLLSALPTITDSVYINGASEPDFAGTPIIELNGSSAGLGTSGLWLTSGASGSTIRGLVINRFAINGILLDNADNVTVAGNYVGTDVTGLIDLGNGEDGIQIQAGASNNSIGGLVAADRNVISGNNNAGVAIDGVATNANTLIGNYIGLGADGATDIGNTHDGVHLQASTNTVIGSTSALGRNVISGNEINGIGLDSATNTIIQGNYIGTNATGLLDRGNTSNGISLVGTTTTTQIGGIVGGNVISGNNMHGVVMIGSGATGNVVQGNDIGTDSTGMVALGNTDDGVHIESGASANTIGGSAAAQRNVISGNGEDGVQIDGDASDGNIVRGNWISVNAAGSATVKNSFDQIYISGGADNTIVGGTLAGEGNWIAGGTSYMGIEISGSSNNTVIQGNRIGTDLAGTANWGTQENGILLWGGATNSLVGGTTVGSGNIVAFSGQGGGTLSSAIAVAEAATGNNAILGNSIYGSVGLGIDLLRDNAVLANDAGDGDIGANDLQNFPVLTAAHTDTSGRVVVAGAINSTAYSSIRIEFFSNTSGDEGQTYLGYRNVITDSAGNANFIESFSATVAVGSNITATATNIGTGNTSEFSGVRATSSALVVDTTADLLGGDTSSIASLLIDKGADGKISLREAIIATNNTAGADAILLSAGTYGLTLAGTGDDFAATGDLDIRDALTIVGADAATTLIDANDLDRVLHVANSSTARITGVTVTDGTSSSDGGGIQVAFGSTLVMTDSVVSNNVTTASGGGISSNGSLVELDAVRVTGNSATTNGGGLHNLGKVAITNSLFDNNSTSGSGGGIYSAGATADLMLINSTLSTNTATLQGGGLANLKDADLFNVTVANNIAGSAGGVRDSGGAAITAIQNSIIAGNTATTDALKDVSGSFDSLGYNIVQVIGTSTGWIVSDQQNFNPLLNALANNGGPTLTHSLQAGSPAINAALATNAPTIDQRGFLRNDGTPDIGAFELNGTNPIPNAAPLLTSNGGGTSAAISVVENITAVTTVTASDSDLPAQTLTYWISGGVDAARFVIHPTTGALTFASTPDFEAPTDAGGNNVYNVTVQVSDGAGGVDTQALAVTVTDQAITTVSATGATTATVGASYTLNLSADEDATSWTINWGDGSIQTVAGDPTSVTHTYTFGGRTQNILVSATDAAGTHTQSDLIVSNTNTNELLRIDGNTGQLVGSLPTNASLNTPSGSVVGPDGRLYVSGLYSSNVVWFDLQAGTTGVFVATGSGGLSSAADLAFGRDGNLYVASFDTDQVLKYHGTTGAYLGVFASGTLGNVDSMTFGPDGNLYVAAWYGGKVYKFDGLTGAQIGGAFVTSPSSWISTIAFGPDGHLYVGDDANSGALLKFNGSTGAFMSTIDAAVHPYNIETGPDGDLYVSDYNGSNRIERYDTATGTSLGVFDSGATGITSPWGLAFIPDEQVTIQTHGIVVTPITGLTTTEAGGTASFSLVLNTAPTANVTIQLGSTDTSEGTISGATLVGNTLTFTSANWNIPQVITVTGVNDSLADGDISYTITTLNSSSTDPNFNNINPSDVSVTNTDNDLYSISGTVFEDVDGDGLVSDDGVGLANAIVSLYRDDGDGVLDAGDTIVNSLMANASGQYTFSGLSNATYWTVADSRTFIGTGGLNGGYTIHDQWAEQTYGSAGSVGWNGAAYTFTGTAGAFFGGMRQDRGDNGASLLTAEHVTKVVVSTASVTGIDYGFSYNAITNTRDGDEVGANNRTIQGSLRQFLQNSNSLVTTQSSNFEINSPLVSGAHTIDIGGFLPTITDAVILDATTEPDFVGTPIVVLNGATAGLGVDGLEFLSGSAGSSVRGFVIQNFDSTGIWVNGTNTITIAGNYIGTDVTGTVAAGNSNGIMVESSTNVTVGGATLADRNVISASRTYHGVWLDNTSSNNVVVGNFIGTDLTGEFDLGNAGAGVRIDNGSQNNTIGGTTPAARNVISGNQGDGVDIQGSGTTGNVVQGNYIGTDDDGEQDLGNSANGINVSSSGNTIGGSAVGAGNVISGNSLQGIYVTGAGVSAVVRGNYVGTDKDGMQALGNTDDGIEVAFGAGGLTIQDNLVATNGQWGITLSGTGAGNTVSGNTVGLNLTQSAILGGAGIFLSSDGNTLTGNTVGGSSSYGMYLTGSANNTIQGNFIGTNSSGAVGLGNTLQGIGIDGVNSDDNLIGGTDTGERNVIANNAMDGISIANGAGTRITILGNTIYGNSDLAIDLDNNGVSGNDTDDSDVGANGLQNYPVITSASISGTDLTLSGGLDTDGLSTQYRIEFYGNPAGTADTTNGEGRIFLGSTIVTTDGGGDGIFTGVTLTGVSIVAGDSVTATATRIETPAQVGVSDLLAYGSTSEFAANLTLTAAGVNNAPVLVASSILNTINEDDITSLGTLVSQMVDTEATDADIGALQGIAITSVPTTDGIWEYTLDGTTWLSVGTPSTSAALLLPADAATAIRFVPNANFNGSTGLLFYKAWDQTTGIAGGTADVTSAGGNTAFSVGSNGTSVTVTAINDAPALTPYAPVYNPTENGAPFTASIATVLSGSASDVDGSPLSGIAIFALAGSGGTLEYSIDGGSSWLSLTSVSASSALLLRSTDSMRFTPDANNGGVITFDYRAWDQTTGTAGSTVDVSTSGGTTAFSSASDRVTVNIASVNDAPTITNGMNISLSLANEDAPSTPYSVSTLLITGGLAYTDVDTGAVQGIAITAATGGGNWQYSTDGLIWINVIGVSTTNALLLDTSTQLRFNPDGQNGGSATIVFRAWDRSTGTASTNSTPAFANPGTGGLATAFSSSSANLLLTVTSVNDAPTIGGGTLTSILEDATSPPGATISSLIASSFIDLDAGASLSGIAVTSNNAPVTEGVWQYSTDSGANWFDVGTVGVNALALEVSTHLRFVPAADFNGNPTILSFRGLDNSFAGGFTSGASRLTVDTTSPGGTSPISSSLVSIGTNVSAVNDAPIRTAGTVANLTVLEDAGLTNLGFGSVAYSSGGGADESSQTLTYSVTAIPSSSLGSVFLADGTTLVTLSTYSLANIQGMQFQPTANASGTSGFQFNVTDSGGTTNGGINSISEFVLITVTGVNDSPVVTTTGTTLAYTENDAATPIDAGLSVSDVDNANVTSATVSISTNYVTGQDTLAFTNQFGITGSWDSVLGVLTLSGTTTPANYQAALRSVTYVNTSNTPSVLLRTVSFVVSDGTLSSTPATRNISVAAINNAPTITTNTLSISEGGTVVLSNAEINSTDADNTPTQLTYSATSITGGQFELVAAPGSSMTSFTQAQVNSGAVQFVHDGGEAAPGYSLTVSDGSLTDGPSPVIGTFTNVNDTPLITAPASVSISASQTSPFVGPNAITLADADAATLDVTITVSNGGYSLSQSTGLTFTTGDGVFDSVMQFSGSIANINAALNGSLYQYSAGHGATESLMIDVSDLGQSGSGGVQTASFTTSLSIAVATPVVGDAFLQGNYLEVGLGQNGAIGSDGAAPVGLNSAGNLLGVQVDNERDGWATYDGDFVTPGTPEETWGVHVGGTTYSNANADVTEISGGLVNFQASPSNQFVQWQGTQSGLQILQTYSVGSNALFMDVEVQLTNLSGADLTDVYYYRNVDPDNNADQGSVDSYSTTNSIVSQGDTGGVSLVSATQSDGSYLGLMGFGENSRVTFGGFNNRNPLDIYQGATGLSQSGSNYADEAVSLAFQYSTIASGETVSLRFRYYFGATDTASPVVDLDANNSGGATGGDFSATFTEGGGPVAIVDSDATVFSPSGLPIDSMQVTMTNLLDGNAESLSVDTTGTSLVATYNSGTGVLTLSGTASDADYRTVLRTLTYDNTSSNPNTTTRQISIVANSGANDSSPVTSFVLVNALNNGPTIDANSLTISEGQTVVLTSAQLHASDSDSSASSLTYTISGLTGGQFENITTPGMAISSFSQADINGGLIQFVHSGGEAAPSYLVTVSDGSMSHGPTAASITFSNVNDTPTISAIANQTINEDTVLGPIAFTIGDNETSAALLNVTATSSNGTLIPNGNIVLGGSGANRTVTLTPALNQFGGPVTITLTVSDGTTSTQSTFDVTVSAVNDSPTIGAATFSLAENAPNGAAVGIVIASDPDVGDAHTFSIIAGDVSGAFAIDNTGRLTVADSAQLDYETTTSWSLTVQVRDTAGATANAIITINLTDLNDNDPVITSDGGGSTTALSLAENTTAVTTVTTTDADTGTIVTYTISGNDAGLFQINTNTGVLTFQLPANLETPLDADGNNIYEVTVIATDGLRTDSQSLQITVTDVNESAVTAIIDSNIAMETVAENATAGTPIGITAFADDADGTDTVSYSLLNSAGGRFTIDSVTGVVTLAAGLDYETASSHTIRVQALSTDGTTSEQDFVLTVTDVNEFGISPLSDSNAANDQVAENSIAGTIVGVTAFANDLDGADTVSYSLINDAGGRFAIDGATGVVTVNAALNYEANASHVIRVQALSSDGSMSFRDITINIIDVNEFATTSISDSNPAIDQILENAVTGTVIGITALADDLDGTDSVSYSLTSNAGGRLAIDSTSGIVTVAGAIDFEATSSLAFTVQALSSDGSLTSRDFVVTVLDANDNAPWVSPGQIFTLAENSSNSTTAGTVLAADVDTSGSLQGWTITGGTGVGAFAINAATGEITVNNSALLDFETTPILTLFVTVSDGVQTSAVQSVTINLSNVNEAPQITGPANTTVGEDGTTAALPITVTDVDTATATLVVTATSSDQALIPNGNIVIAGSGANRNVTITPTADMSGGPVTITLTVSDGSLSTQTTFLVTVTAQNDPPTISVVSDQFMNEDTTTAPLAITLGDIDTSVNALTVSASSSNQGLIPNGNLVVSGTGANRTVTITPSADMNGGPVTITLIVSDGTLTSQRTLTVNVAAVNDLPVVPPQGFTVSENSGIGTVVGTVIAADIDTGDVLSYAISAGNTNAAFAIDSSTGLITVANSAALNFELTPQYLLTVSVTDSSGIPQTTTITIQLLDRNEVPTSLSLSSASVNENSPVGTLLGLLSSSDVDAGDGAAYSLLNDAGGLFTVDSNTGAVTVNGGLDFEASSNHTIVARITDNSGLVLDRSFVISLVDLNEAPVFAGGSFGLAENSATGTLVGTLTASDADAGDSLAFSLIAGNTNGAFSIDANTGAITVANSAAMDFESNGTFTLTAQVTDHAGLSQQQAITVTLSNVNESPTVLASTFHVQEWSTVGSIVGMVTASDIDAGDLLTYSFVAGNTGGRFAIDPSTGLITVANSVSFSHESRPSYTVTVQVQDAGGLTQSAAVTLVVDNVNQPPLTVGDQYQLDQFTSLTTTAINGVLFNDSDVDSVGMTAILVSAPQHGTLTLNADGTLTYSPDDNFSGVDTFTYQATDGLEFSGPTTVTFDVSIVAGGGSGFGGDGLDSGDDGDEDTDSENESNDLIDTDDSGDGEGDATSTNTNGLTPGDAGKTGSRPNGPNKTDTDIPFVQINGSDPRAQVLAGVQQSLLPELNGHRSKRAGQAPRGRSGAWRALAPVVSHFLPDPVQNMTVSFLGNQTMWNELNSIRNELRDQRQSSAIMEKIVVGTTTAVTGGLTVGYVIWLIRGGSLLATMVSVVPTWMTFDPLPVMDRFEEERPLEDHESLASIVSGSAGR